MRSGIGIREYVGPSHPGLWRAQWGIVRFNPSAVEIHGDLSTGKGQNPPTVWKGHSGWLSLSTQEGEQLGQQGGYLTTRCEGERTSHYWEGEGKTASSFGSGMSGWKTEREVGKEVGGVRLCFADEFAGIITGRQHLHFLMWGRQW